MVSDTGKSEVGVELHHIGLRPEKLINEEVINLNQITTLPIKISGKIATKN